MASEVTPRLFDFNPVLDKVLLLELQASHVLGMGVGVEQQVINADVDGPEAVDDSFHKGVETGGSP